MDGFRHQASQREQPQVVETLRTAFQRCSQSMASGINLNLEGAGHAHAGQSKLVPASPGFLTAQIPFGMTTSRCFEVKNSLRKRALGGVGPEKFGSLTKRLQMLSCRALTGRM
jgi:hypothetical protein